MTLLDGSAGAGNGEGAAAGAGNPAAGTPPVGAGAGTPPSGTPSWRDTLPEDIKGNGALAQFKDINDLAKSYVHAQAMIGKKGVIVPGEKASDEEWSKFYKDIGQPEVDKFEIAPPKDSKVNADFLKGLKEHAHKMGMLPKQAQGILDWYLSNEKVYGDAAMKELQTAQEKGLGDLKQEWGQGYDKQIASAQAAVRELGGPEMIAYLNETGFGNDPKLIRLMAKAGALLGEDKIRGEGAGKFGQTPDEIRKEINSIMGNPQHPYFDSAHPSHRSAVAEMGSRYKALG